MNNQIDRPTRIIFNFAQRCALKCEWCYVPFGSPPPQHELIIEILNRIKDFGFKTITIGGGDPFQYRHIGEMLTAAKGLGLFVHVDTHGKALQETETNLRLLERTTDLLGFPLDGPNSQVHDTMRSSPGHFEIVRGRLAWLRGSSIPIKINTVVSSVNVYTLLEIGKLIREIAPSRWSIYQYWPLGPGERVIEKHSVKKSVFCAQTSILSGLFQNSSVILEINSSENRRLTYPIVHHDGLVFLHSASNPNEFASLGSIFSTDVLSNIMTSCKSERQSASTRYDFL